MKYNIDLICEIAIEAGNEIMKIYKNEDLQLSFKEDSSPLTIADQKSNECIINYLSKYFPDTPIISEEEREVSYEERKHYNYYFCVDPLDGTKEFIKRNGEFTVNIALIRDRFPIFGVIYAPVLNKLYWGDFQKGAYSIETGNDSNNIMKIDTKSQLFVNKDFSKGLTAVVSRSHAGNEEELIQQNNIKKTISIGSALKFCMLAEGKADVYIRTGPTMEWDTAAGQAIIEAAGGIVLDKNKLRFIYNKKNLLNGSFTCLAKANLIK